MRGTLDRKNIFNIITANWTDIYLGGTRQPDSGSWKMSDGSSVSLKNESYISSTIPHISKQRCPIKPANHVSTFGAGRCSNKRKAILCQRNPK